MPANLDVGDGRQCTRCWHRWRIAKEFVSRSGPSNPFIATQRVRVVKIDHPDTSCNNEDSDAPLGTSGRSFIAGFAATAPSSSFLALKAHQWRVISEVLLVDRKLLRSTLRPQCVHQLDRDPCGGDFLAAEANCSAEIVTLANPDQAILIIRGGDFSYTVESFRYRQDPRGA